MTTLHVDEHPLLVLNSFSTELPKPLGELPSPVWLTELLRLGANAPLQSSDAIRTSVRDLLRHGGYKPTGRGKPAAEYLLRAAGEGTLGSINLVVDACNVVSLHSGIPISVVDLDRAAAPYRVGIAEPGASYVFNSAGQEIDVAGLLCFFDQAGPCANAVKDAQRTKTNESTRRTVSILWGAKGLEEQVTRAAGWYRELLERAGATTGSVSQS